MIEHNISISKYNPLAGISYKKFLNSRKWFINIQNIYGNECFKWCIVRYLNPADHHPAIITKTDKNLPKGLDFKDIKLPVKTRDIHKNEERIPSALVF